MKFLRHLACFRYHYRKGQHALFRLNAMLDFFGYDEAVTRQHCPISYGENRLASRRHARLARFYRRRLPQPLLRFAAMR